MSYYWSHVLKVLSKMMNYNPNISLWSHLHLLQVFCQVLSLSCDRYIVVLPLLLGQQLEPPSHLLLDDLTHTKAQGPHEVIPGCSVPVPHLHWQATILVFWFQVSRKKSKDKQKSNNWILTHILSVSFQTGLRLSLIVFVFLFWDSPFSGTSLIFT